MPDISKITLPSGTTYDIKDTVARAAVAGGVSYIGVSTTAITDGGSEKPTINGSQQTPINGNLVIYDSGEFIFTGEYGSGGTWSEFGDMSNLGDFAYVDHGYTQAFTPSGTVSQPTFTGTGARLVTDNISVPTSASFSGDSLTSTGAFTPAGTISLNITHNNSRYAVSPASSGTTTYTPSGSVSAPTISVDSAGSTTTIKNPTSTTKVASVVTANAGATAPSNPLSYAEVSSETLILNQVGYTTGDTITTSNVTVKTGDASYTASQPSFTGDGVRLQTASIEDTSVSSATFTGTEGSVSVTGTPSGSISFTNTNKTATVSATSGTATYTPSGTVSQPTFSGNQIIDVQVDTNQHSL